MANFIRRSLSTKLSLNLLALAVPLFFASVGVLFIHSRHMVRRASVERANGTLHSTMQLIGRYLITAETATNANSWLVEQSLTPDSMLAFTQRIVWMNPYTDGCSICMEPDALSEEQKPYSVYTVRNGTELTTVVDQECEVVNKIKYKIPRYLKKPCWEVYYNKVDTLKYTLDGMIVSYHRPLYDANKRFAGVISTDLSMEHLSKMIGETKPYPHSYFMLLDEDGHYLVHPDSTRLLNKTIFSGKNPRYDADIIALGHEMTKGAKGRMNIWLEGERALVCYQPVPGTTWSLAIVCPDKDILKGYYRLTNIVIALLIIGFILILVNCYRVVKRSIRPLNQLLPKVKEIAEGNMEVHISRSTRKDIIGELQNSYSKMLSSLNFYMGSVRYTTEQTQMRNEELEKATALVVEADKQKTQFIQNMTHQVRTPLNIIMGFSQVLKNETSNEEGNMTEEEIKKITETIKQNTMLINRLMLMLFDSSDTGKSESYNYSKDDVVLPNEIVRKTIEYLHMVFSEVPIDFKSEVPDDFTIKTNFRNLHYSIGEILLNAARHSDGKNVKVRIRLTDSTLQFIVQDTGKGISEADREKIFKFFTKMDDFSEGLGLGLPLTMRHATELGGKFWLDTDYKNGCRFIFEVPIN